MKSSLLLQVQRACRSPPLTKRWISSTTSSLSSLATALADDHPDSHSDWFEPSSFQSPATTSNGNGSSPQDSSPCGQRLSHHSQPLPPPLPPPKYSVYKRVLPEGLTAHSSPKGRQMLLQALQNETAESYYALMEQFTNQSDPAYCGVTTLMVVLNAMAIDPKVRWKGGWRFFAQEDVLLEQCGCLRPERIQRVGISLEEFRNMAHCQGVRVQLKRAVQEDDTARSDCVYTVDDFRNDVHRVLSSSSNHETGDMLVVSFARHALGQTGEGHFSPIAAVHDDQVLVLDVARFKYTPYWVSIDQLYQAMQPLDQATQLPRGWLVVSPPPLSQSYQGTMIKSEQRKRASQVPVAGQDDPCPLHSVKIDYCPTTTAWTKYSKKPETAV